MCLKREKRLSDLLRMFLGECHHCDLLRMALCKVTPRYVNVGARPRGLFAAFANVSTRGKPKEAIQLGRLVSTCGRCRSHYSYSRLLMLASSTWL